MKTFTLLIFILLSLNVYSQNTYIPDDNFEQALIDLGYDTVLDDYVLTSNINTVTFLNVNNSNISDLTGIEDFTSLTELRCFGNQLTVLDVSQNLSLEILNCGSNSLTALDVRDNTQLEELRCGNNSITQLNLSLNTSLTVINCNNNALEALMVNNGNNTNVTEFNASSNPNLTCIEVDDITYSYTNWGNYDAQTSFSEDCHFNDTYVPDDNFEQALIDFGFDNVLDDYVLTNNINSVTYLDVDNKNISDLTGIEGFVALTTLHCSDNNLTSIDISNNTDLNTLDISNNAITELDISSNLAISSLSVDRNELTSLDLRQHTVLTYLLCYSNQLESLYLNNGNNTSITGLNVTNNPNLFCVKVDDPAYSTANWTYVDPQTSFSEFCDYSDTYVPDNNFEQALIDLGYDSGVLDDYVSTINIEGVIFLNLNNLNIADLTGIEDFTALSELRCYGNQLTNLDVSENSSLTILNCGSNLLTNLDVTNNLLLEELRCGDNTIVQLNLENNSNLTVLNCSSNALEELNVSNGNNTNMITFDATSNANLTCIQVNDPAYCSANWTSIDAQTSFANDCHYNDTYVPDDNFEQALIDLGYDSVLDDYIDTDDINAITTLNIDSKNISDLTGIEDFAALVSLYVSNNALTNLDVSNNVSLENLFCNNNQLTTIDLSQNTSLKQLYCANNSLSTLPLNNNILLDNLHCYGNDLTSLDISNNAALVQLYCYDNQLTNLDVTNNTLLEFLFCRINDISSLDVSQNTALTILKCDDNNLTSLDVSQNPSLTTLTCHINNLETLNVKNGNNSNFLEFNATSNSGLTCITVDNATYSTTNWTNIDAQTTFSESCSTLSIDDVQISELITLYPNPTRNVININTASIFQINLVEIFNTLGKKVLLSNDTSINIRTLNSGLYFVKVSLGEKEVIKKLIIN